MKVDPDQDAGTVLNSVKVSADESDLVTANNAAVESIGLVREVNLVTTKTNVSPPAPGEDVLYALTVTNSGPSSARNTSVVDDLPSQVSYVAALSSSGCTLTSAPSEVTCSLGTIQPGRDGEQHHRCKRSVEPGGRNRVGQHGVCERG